MSFFFPGLPQKSMVNKQIKMSSESHRVFTGDTHSCGMVRLTKQFQDMLFEGHSKIRHRNLTADGHSNPVCKFKP
jgi:hypothetical protein